MTPTPTEIADSLLPCPFPHLGKELLHGSWPAKHQFWIHCPCGAMGPHADSPAKAIAAWNRRATSRDHRAAAEEIENAITAPLDLRGDKYLFGDEIMSLLKDRAEEVAAILSRRFPASPKPELAKEFDALAEKATHGEVTAHQKNNYFRGYSAQSGVLFDFSTSYDAAFIAFCFNHRPEISRALGGAVGDEWRDIATAPKDGTEILLWGAGYLHDGRRYAKCCHVGWFEGDWMTRDVDLLCEATHWRPLPPPPSALKPQGGEE